MFPLGIHNMRIPEDQLYIQTNQGDTFGVLGDTRNMILDVPGKVMLSRKPVAILTSLVDADVGYTMSLVYFSDSYIAVTEDEIFEGTLDGRTWGQVASSPATSLSTDAIVFNGYLYVTTDNNLSRWNGNATWNNSLASLTSGVPHPMCTFDSLTTYKLAIGNGNTVKTYDTSHNANATVLTLETQYQVTSLRYRNGYLYVGTKNLNGGEAKVFIWNGDGVNPQYECPVGSEWIFSMCEYGTSVAVVTGAGQLLQVVGSTAKELAAFPVAFKPDVRWQGGTGLLLNGKVFNRGMVAIKENIYINVEGDVDVGFVPEMKSGIWVYNPVTGLNHRTTSVTDDVVRDTSLSVSNSVITTSAAHKLKTGDAVVFDSVSGLTGVSDQYLYYVTVLTTTTIKLSMSRTGVEEEEYVTIGGTPTVGDVLVYSENSEYGSNYRGTSGAIMRTVYAESPLPHLTSEIIWGTKTDNPSGDDIYALNAFSDSYNVGTFSTQRIYSEYLEETWKEAYAFIDGLFLEDEQVQMKIQTKFQDPSQLQVLSGVWASADTINLNVPAEFAAWADIQEGNELVLINGYGQGYTVHVQEGGITTTALTVSLKVDEELGSAGEEVEFYFTTFKRCNFPKTNEEKGRMEYIRAEIENSNSTWCILKFEMRGFRTAINTVDLSKVKHSGGL